jgi:hypothetical protein
MGIDPVSLAIAGGSAAYRAITGGRRETQTSTQQLDPEGQAFLSNLRGRATADLDSPFMTSGFQASRNQAVTNVNKATDNSRKRLETNLAGRGFGQSGLIAAGANELEANRVNAISGIEGNLIQFIEQQKRDEEQRRFSNALSLLGPGFGSSSTTKSRQPFDPMQFLQPFLFSQSFGGGGGGGSLQGASQGTQDIFDSGALFR